MCKIELITDKSNWDSIIESFVHSDFYHTYDYHLLSKNENDTPILIKYTEGNLVIVLPLLIRKIDGTDFSDATSVYGYPGPLTNKIKGDFDNSNFKEKLNLFFLEKNIVSVFSRLNPFIPNQDLILNGIGETSFHGKIVNIDLTKSLDQQREQYNRRLKSYINNARKKCTIKKAVNKESINEYINAYYENMHRVNAAERYFFPEKYFYDLINCKDFETDILLAINNDNNDIMAGAMFIKKNNIVQYHLSGIKEEYLSLNPIKLLIDEMRINATQQNYTYFNLGGGVNSQQDSLFQFKSTFSKDFKDFKLWKYIVNENIYNQLIIKNMELTREESTTFFPAYRENR